MRARSITISTGLVLALVLACASVSHAKDDPKFGPAVDAFCEGMPGFETLPVLGKPYTVGTPWPPEGESCGGCHTGFPGLPEGPPFFGCDPALYGSKCELQPQFDWWKAGNAAGGDFSAFCPPASNNAPIANAGPDQSVPTGATVTLDGSGSSDADGDPLTYSWTLTPPSGSAAALSDPTAIMPTFTVDVPGDYVSMLVVNDGMDDSAPDSVSVSTVNSPPVASAGPDQRVFVGDTVTLDGSGSSDIDGDPLSYSWSLTSVPTGSNAALSAAGTVMPAFQADMAGQYVVQLIVNDGLVDGTADTVTVTTQNTPPVADAGPDQSVLAEDTVTLDGSGSSDIDGDPLGYWWSLTSVPAGSGATLSDPTAVMPTFVADVAGTYVSQLIVNDGTVDSGADTVSVMAGANNVAPVADAGPDQSVSTGDLVTLDGSGSSDVDGDPLSYSWSLTMLPTGSNATLSAVDTVMPTFRADMAGRYVAQLIVNDGLADSGPDTVVITTEANNTPPVADAGPDQSVLVGDTVMLDGSGSSDVDGDPLGYWWSLTSVPAGSGSSISDPSAVMPSFVADVAGAYVAQLIVNDGAVDGTPDTVVVTTADQNAAPAADAGPDQQVMVGDTVMLDGRGSSDADGQALSYLWSIISRPVGSTTMLSDPAAAMPTFAADLQGDFVVQLIVNDGTVDSPPDSVAISAQMPMPAGDAEIDAVWDSRKGELKVKGEGFASGAVVEVYAMYPDREVSLGKSYESERGDGSWRFKIALAEGDVPCRVKVVDDEGSAYYDDVRKAPGCDGGTANQPPVADAGDNQIARVGDTVMLDGSGSHDPDGDPLTYHWSFVKKPTGSTAMLSGASTMTPSFVADRRGAYTVELTVSDGQLGSKRDSVRVVVPGTKNPSK